MQLFQCGGFVGMRAVYVVFLLQCGIVPRDGVRDIEARPSLACAVALGCWQWRVGWHGGGSVGRCVSL